MIQPGPTHRRLRRRQGEQVARERVHELLARIVVVVSENAINAVGLGASCLASEARRGVRGRSGDLFSQSVRTITHAFAAALGGSKLKARRLPTPNLLLEIADRVDEMPPLFVRR